MQYGRSLKTGSGAKKTMNYLHYALRYPKRTARKIIWAYGKSLGLEKPVGLASEPVLKEIGDIIQNDWNKFMSFYGGVKDLYQMIKLTYILNLQQLLLQMSIS